MAVNANANGRVSGKFTIPAGVTAGLKEVIFRGAGGSFGTGSFFGQGVSVENVLQQVTNVTKHYYDPLAQTFLLDVDRQIGAVDLHVAEVGTSDLIVQIRETLVGIPTQKIIAETRIKPGALLRGDWNRFIFPHPVTLPRNVEHAIVVLCNDPVTEVSISELGKWDMDTQRWVTSQAYNVGVLLSSANASTWTAHQDRKLAFRLLAAKYTQTERVIDLGNVPAANVTDIIVSALTDNPANGADSDIEVTFSGGEVRKTGDRQVIKLAGPTSGTVNVKARLRATQHMSAAISPGSQLIMGLQSNTGTYISVAFDADAADSNARVLFDAQIPSGATVKAFIAGTGVSDPWVELTQAVAPKAIGNGIYEFNYYKADINKAAVRVKIEITGTAAARPRVANLRVSIT